MQDKQNLKYFRLIDNPKHVNVADRPPRLGGTVRQIPTEEFIKQHNLTEWCEGIAYESGVIPRVKVKSSSELNNQEIKGLCQLLIKNREKLAVCFMGEAVGSGVFALDDLPEHTTVALFGGFWRQVSPNHPTKEHYGIFNVALIDDDTMTSSINSEKRGNISRFFQHLPSSKKLSKDNINVDSYSFEPGSKKVATANLYHLSFSYDGYPVVTFTTARKIDKGEQLGWDYSLPYWINHRIVPSLFDIDGAVIDPELYKVNTITLRVYDDKDIYTLQITVDELYTAFQKEDHIHLQAPNNSIIAVSEKDYELELKKYNHSPYVVFDKPSSIKCDLRSPSSLKETDENGKIEEKKKSTTSGQYSAHRVFKVPKADPKIIIEQLKRITASENEWGYSGKTKTAFLHFEDKDKMDKISTYLQQQGLQIKSGNNARTKKPLVYVVNPDIEKLRTIEPFESKTAPFHS